MRLGITGATGFVGSQCVKRFAHKGYSIKALVRRTSDVSALTYPGVELVYGNVTESGSLEQAFQGVEAMIHLASKVGEKGSREEFHAVNVIGTQNLLEVARTLALKRFIHVSSLSVITGYQDHDGTAEDAPYQPTGEPYADSKIETEKLVLDAHHRYGLPVTVLRPGFIYGPGDKVFLPTVIQNLKAGKVILIDGGKKLLNLTYMGNLIEAMELALDKKESVGEVFNITDGEKISKQKFFFTVADLMRLARPSRSIPFSMARLLSRVGILSRLKLRFAGQNQLFSIAKAERLLGYRHPIHFEEAMKEAVAWYQKNF